MTRPLREPDPAEAYEALDHRDVPLEERRRRAELRALLRRHEGVRDVVVFPPSIGWELPHLFQRPQQMARAFARAGCLVLYGEPEYEARHRDGFTAMDERLYLANVPPQVLDEIDSPVAVVFIYSWEPVRFLRSPRIVYEHLDSLDLLGATRERLRAHRSLLGRAAVVTATAARLWREVAPQRPDALLCPNAADREHFAPAAGDPPPPAELREIAAGAEALAGYAGTLSPEWFDYALVAEAARRRPRTAFVLIGTDETGGLERSGLLAEPNVHWLGPRPYRELPRYVAHFDVALIPFVSSPITQCSSPVKLFEYLAAGRPVVATDLEECRRTPLARIARDADELAHSLDELRGRARDPSFRAACERFARENDWLARAEQVLEAVGREAEAGSGEREALRWRIGQLCSDLAEAEMAIATQAWTVGELRNERERAERAWREERERAERERREEILRLEREAQQRTEADAREIERLREELRRIHASTGWRLILAERRLQRRVRRGLRRTGRALLPSRLLRAVARLSPLPQPMSWHAYAFDRFKRAWSACHAGDLSSLRLPSEPGLVSIVLPVYDGERYLREAIDSVLDQTYERFELIAVDDGSTDASGAILDGYAARDRRVRVIHQENRGLPEALSRGFREARGAYLTWTSCDNRLASRFLEEMVAALDRHPEWDAVWSDVEMIGEEGEPLRGSGWYAGYQEPPGSERVRFPADPSELNTWPNNYVGAAFLYRDRVAALLGDYSRFRFGTEDYDYWMRVNEMLTLRKVDLQAPLYQYRFCRGSLTDRDEELGITRGRAALMVFDDFRRDFCLSPLAWIVRADEAAAGRAEELRRAIRAAGHLLLEPAEVGSEWPRLWAPLVDVQIVASSEAAAAAVPQPASEHALPVVVSAAEAPPDGAAVAGWALRFASTGTPGGLDPRRGWAVVPDAAALFTALDVFARSRHFERIEAEIHEPPPPRLRASVVVCTWRRGERLRACLESLAHQTLPAREFEVLVVNNDPADASVAERVAEARSLGFGEERLRLLSCPFPGLSHARNVGLGAAHGEICCFIDDDALACEDLLERVCEAFALHPRAGVIGGHIRLRQPSPRPAALRDGWGRYWSEFLTGHRRYARIDHWWDLPWGANWSARRAALVAIGGFRTRYGRSGDDFAGGEELTAARLVQQLGWEVGIEPRAEVLHDVQPERFTFDHVRRTIRAGTLVNYQGQRDLYLPRETTIGATLRTISSLARARAAALLGGRSDDALVLGYRLEAHRRLLARQLADARARRRPTLASERS